MRVVALLTTVVLSAILWNPSATPCSVFNYTWDGETRVGRNLDWIPNSWGWVQFVQPTDRGFGAMYFGAETDIWPQGGMNDQGLVLGMTATPFLEIIGNPDGLPMQLDFWDSLFSSCATVSDVLAFLDQYDLSSMSGYFERGQMLWTDRFGDSVIVEGDVVIHRIGSFQIITNYLQSHPELGGWPCARYHLIEQALTGQGTMTDDELISIVDAAHGTLWGGYTVWSLLYRPNDLTVTVFNRGDFSHAITIDLAVELAAGTDGYDLDELFAQHVFGDGFEGGGFGAWSLPGVQRAVIGTAGFQMPGDSPRTSRTKKPYIR